MEFHHHLYNHDVVTLARMKCNHKTFFDPTISPQDKCIIALGNCDGSFDFVNFFAINYCYLGGLIYVNIQKE